MIEGTELELFERSIRQAIDRHSGEKLDAALAELGWLDALSVDLPTATALLFSRQGAANATSSALDYVVRAGLGVGPESEAAVVLPPLGSWAAPGDLAGQRLTVHGLGTSALSRHDRAVVAASTNHGTDATPVTVEVAALSLRPISGIDPASGLVEVIGEDLPCLPLTGDTGTTWPEAVARAQLAIGYELVGASRAMLHLAQEHALNRVQFGRPIAKFQAIRHRLADTLVAIEAADAVLAASWEAPLPHLAACAKAVAGRGARTAARHCQQVLAGIGFTAEHPFHRHFRRILLLDQLFGTARALTESFGAELLASRQLPDLLAL